MLKELVLSLILSAYSAAPFLDSPKRASVSQFFDGDYYFSFAFNSTRTELYYMGFETPFSGFVASGQETVDIFEQSDPEGYYYSYFDFSGIPADCEIEIEAPSAQAFGDDNYMGYSLTLYPLEASQDFPDFSITGGTSANQNGESYYDKNAKTFSCSGNIYVSDFVIGENDFTIGFNIDGAQTPTYINPTFNFIGCRLEGNPGNVRPGGNLSITVISSDNYGFPDGSSALISGSGYSTVSFVSGSEPVDNTGLFSKVTYLFTNCAEDLTATIAAAYLPTWSLAYQDGYDEGLDGPTNQAYTNGYNNGKSDGYRTGYQDGKKDYQAGGIWSWFESAANVLASFLDIRLFPSFTIGNLIGALVGLTIILFFVRAFLFKS